MKPFPFNAFINFIIYNVLRTEKAPYRKKNKEKAHLFYRNTFYTENYINYILTQCVKNIFK